MGVPWAGGRTERKRERPAHGCVEAPGDEADA